MNYFKVLYCVACVLMIGHLQSCGKEVKADSLTSVANYEVVCFVSNMDAAALSPHKGPVLGLSRLVTPDSPNVSAGAPSPDQTLTVSLSKDARTPDFILELFWLGQSDYAGAVLVPKGESGQYQELSRVIARIEPTPRIIRADELPEVLAAKYHQ